MSGMKRLKKLMGLLALVLCLAFAVILAFTFAACDDVDASGEAVVPSQNPEDYIDTETIVPNENAVITKDFDENGVAECVYDYGENCLFCEGVCEGHEMYLTKGGGVYDFYPVAFTQALIAEDGSMDINSEIRLSLIFDDTYSTRDTEYLLNDDESVSYIDYYYRSAIYMVEISSLTGEPLEIESIELRQHMFYDFEYSIDAHAFLPVMYYVEDGFDCELVSSESVSSESKAVSETWIKKFMCTDITKTYYVQYWSEGYFILTLRTADGGIYTYDFWSMVNVPSVLAGAEVVYV